MIGRAATRVLVAALAAGVVLDCASAPAAQIGCAVVWSVVAKPSIAYAQLYAVSSDAPDDAWAVGGAAPLFDTPPHRQAPALTLHWNGTGWRRMPNPLGSAVLEGVAVDARDDAWAVGAAPGPYGASDKAVAAHWNGATWARVALPPLRRLTAVAATSPVDVWAVGADRGGTAVALHWNGAQWQTRLRLPAPPGLASDLNDVSALSPSDVWVVGDASTGTADRFFEAHWDGQRWKRYSQPPPTDKTYGPDESPELTAVGAVATDDVWAAGDAGNAGGPAWPDTVLFHWTGAGWRKEPAPGNLWVDDLASRAPGDVWLAGLNGNGDAFGGPALWRQAEARFQAPFPSGAEEVAALAPDASDGLWAVGAALGAFDSSLQFPHRAQPMIARGRCG